MSSVPDLDQLKYPLGKFDGKRPETAAERAAMIAMLREHPKAFRNAVAGLSDVQLDTPYRDGGWSVRQLVHHVSDSHMYAYMRLKHALTEDDYMIKAYNQTNWVNTPDGSFPIELSLDILDGLHEKWARLFESISAEQFDRKLEHPERPNANLDVKWLLGLYSWHGRHHTAHITKLRERMGW
ncbi:MAG: putative metal-dependent hydrolase [Calditrichaeota bacterium]|nr:putative metal-dependent hydrolase [Calditrichota bacterium]